ncbi:hypothetical protein Lbru_0689 [Legionella brunensis]|uniref:Uncharacterized protein n=1 Tax=Legionella brunensis TaxID=29422 RepID=A0A0W0SU07_9GAMM|nr:hypothetical protein [Legionella brunensis]KTC86748.1 hypothetical protein Lbru_0689 [Legionella brunensis]
MNAQGPQIFAIDSVRLRCAAFAEAKAVVLIAPRLEAVAPITIILPWPFLFISGMTA